MNLPHSSGEFFISHFVIVFDFPPKFCICGGILDHEHTVLFINPGDHFGVVLGIADRRTGLARLFAVFQILLW